MVARETSLSTHLVLPSAFALTVKLKMIPVQLGIHNAPMKFILSIHMVYKQMCEREIHTYTFH